MNSLAARVRRLTTNQKAAAITVPVVAFAILALLHGGRQAVTPTAIATVVAVGAAVTVAFRLRHPVAVLLVVGSAHLFVIWNISNEIPLVPAVALSLYTVARHGDRRTSLTVAAAVGIVLSVGIAALDAEGFFSELGGELAVGALPIAVGDAVRSRSDRIRDLIDTEANTRVQAERIRIARDLHDVVAHGLSTIAIQSGVAAHLIDQDPRLAKEALQIINTTGKDSLEELRAMVGVLRSTDDAPLRPTPADPNDISDLVQGAAKAGIDLSVEATGSFPSPVGDSSVVVAMHRIIQEALTNVARHAGAAATTLSIQHGTDQVTITITNDSGTKPGPVTASTGVGIIGMRERAESLGGTLTAALTPYRGFQVVAVLPYKGKREDTP